MTAVPSVTTREGLREALGDARPGLVPTMGALHAGHLSLISRSASENPLTVVSVFVNPTQFTNPEDLAHYPRDLETDVALARQAGADLIFAPTVEAIYPSGFDTTVEVGHLSDRWEGASRPGHLRAVATVVTILLNLANPPGPILGRRTSSSCKWSGKFTAIWRCQGRSSAAQRCGTKTGWRCRLATCSFRGMNALVPWRCPAPSQRFAPRRLAAKPTLAGSKRSVSRNSTTPVSRWTISRLSTAARSSLCSPCAVARGF